MTCILQLPMNPLLARELPIFALRFVLSLGGTKILSSILHPPRLDNCALMVRNPPPAWQASVRKCGDEWAADAILLLTVPGLYQHPGSMRFGVERFPLLPHSCFKSEFSCNCLKTRVQSQRKCRQFAQARQFQYPPYHPIIYAKGLFAEVVEGASRMPSCCCIKWFPMFSFPLPLKKIIRRGSLLYLGFGCELSRFSSDMSRHT